MNTKEKSLELADIAHDVFIGWCSVWKPENWNPYGSSWAEQATCLQIILKFPEVMRVIDGRLQTTHDGSLLSINHPNEPTQANILDEILRLCGVEL